MSTVSIYGFSDESAANKLFEQLKSTTGIDAVYLQKGSRIMYSRELGDFDSVEGSLVFTIIAFPGGTPIKLDAGSSESA